MGALPAAPGEENASSLVRRMASIAHKSVMAELTAMQKDLERYHRAGERND